MRIGRIAHEELAEAMRRGWGERDCRAAMMLQEERAGVAARVSPERLPDALKD
jgi:3-hydroxyisobutyrate dehydrogenase